MPTCILPGLYLLYEHISAEEAVAAFTFISEVTLPIQDYRLIHSSCSRCLPIRWICYSLDYSPHNRLGTLWSPKGLGCFIGTVSTLIKMDPQ